MPSPASFAPLIGFLVLSVGLAFSLTNAPEKMPSALIDKAAPVFALAALDGRSDGLSNEDLRGESTLLNVFASWCPACRMEHPFLMRLASRRDVRLVGIDWKDSQQKAKRWLHEHRDPYERVGFDENGRVGLDLGVTGVPETFVIDSGGRVRYRHAGPLTEEVWRDIFEPLLSQLRRTP